MELVNKFVFAVLLICYMLYPLEVSAAWNAPVEIIKGSWGGGSEEFGFKSGNGEMEDQFPTVSLLLSNGKIIIEDRINNRLKIYDQQGGYVKSLDQKGLGLYELGPDKVVTFFWDELINKERIGVFNPSTEDWLWKDTKGILDSAAEVAVVNENIFIWDGKRGYKYSSSGGVLETYTKKPLEMGVVKEDSLGGGRYQYTITFTDKVYSIKSGKIIDRIVRDASNNIYGILKISTGEEFSTYKIDKYTVCEKRLGELALPVTQFQPQIVEKQIYGVVEHPRTVIAEYGSPVIAPNGDVYTWKRTPDKYSILKWTWVDDPNVPTGPDAPTGLTLMPSTTGIYLTWTASPSDPGCVTGYEVARATSAGGVGSTVATVNAGVVKYNDTTATAGTTYYYKVRAKAGSEYAPYTTEVSGKR